MWVIVFLFHLFVFERKFSRRAKFFVLGGCLAVVANLCRFATSRPRSDRIPVRLGRPHPPPY